MSDNFNSDLQNHLWKCEIEFTAKRYPNGHCIDWLAHMCTSTESTAQFLRSIGFKIRDVVDEEPWPGELHQWVETTSGIIVYTNNKYLKGFIAYGRKNSEQRLDIGRIGSCEQGNESRRASQL